jgi:hypothetical protein
MIDTQTQTTITCDKCGRAIELGEKWFQVMQQSASSVFEGQAANLTTNGYTLVQLCSDDYAKVEPLLLAAAPLSSPPPPPAPAVAAPAV